MTNAPLTPSEKKRLIAQGYIRYNNVWLVTPKKEKAKKRR